MRAAQAFLLGSLTAAVASLGLGTAVKADWLAPLDGAVVAPLQYLLSGMPRGAWIVLSAPGSAAIIGPVTAVAALALWLSGSRLSGGLLVIATAGGYGLMYLLKALVARSRPALDPADSLNPDSLGLAAWDPASDAFPSGHALLVLVVYGFLASVLPNRIRGLSWMLALSIMLLVGASRVALGAHWPSDVLGSWLVGASWLLLLLGVRAALVPVVR